MNIFADIGNSQLKIAIERNNDISRVKAFQLNDFVSIKKYSRSLSEKGKLHLFYSSVLDRSFDKALLDNLKLCYVKIIRFKSTRSLLKTTNSYKKASNLGSDRWAQIVAARNIFKKNCIIINAARGGIINEIDLDKALRENLIFGAGLDVFETEPPKSENPLLKNDKVFLSPHTAAFTEECMIRMGKETIQNIIDFFEKRLDKSKIIKL